MSIAQVGADFINEILEFLVDNGGTLPFAELERSLIAKVQACVCDIMSQYIEEVNNQIVLDKSGRRRAGFAVERHEDERRILTSFGEMCYARTYFVGKDGTYSYLADKAVGVESYARVRSVSSCCRRKYSKRNRRRKAAKCNIERRHLA